MTISEDVRRTISDALENARNFALEGEMAEQIDAARAWLDAQPNAPEIEGQPPLPQYHYVQRGWGPLERVYPTVPGQQQSLPQHHYVQCGWDGSVEGALIVTISGDDGAVGHNSTETRSDKSNVEDSGIAQPTEHWEPVTDMPYTQTQSTVDGTIGIYYEDGVIGIGSGGAFLASPLPDGYALCRKVEVNECP